MTSSVKSLKTNLYMFTIPEADKGRQKWRRREHVTLKLTCESENSFIPSGVD